MGDGIGALHNPARAAPFPGTTAISPSPRLSSVEFFGLPGSGKTALALELTSLLRRAGCPTYFSGDVMGDRLPFQSRSLCRLKLITRELPRRPRFAFQAAASLIASPGQLWDRSKTVWNYCSVLAMSLRHIRCGREMLVLDQGLVQAVWSGRMHGTGNGSPADTVALIADDWFDQCLFVHVQAAKDLARSRLLSRAQRTSRLQMPERIGRKGLWDKGEQIALDIADQLGRELDRRSQPSHLMRVQNDGRHGLQELAAAIFCRLEPAGPSRLLQ